MRLNPPVWRYLNPVGDINSELEGIKLEFCQNFEGALHARNVYPSEEDIDKAQHVFD